MKAPIYVRALNPAEQAAIEAGLRSSHAFTLRRSQILLASSREQCPREIARNLGCATQTVRNAIHAFEQKGSDNACVTVLDVNRSSILYNMQKFLNRNAFDWQDER